MITINPEKWTAVKHKTGRGGPYTFHHVIEGMIPVSHRYPTAQSNKDWWGRNVQQCVQEMLISFGEGTLIIKQFDSFEEMFQWLSDSEQLD